MAVVATSAMTGEAASGGGSPVKIALTGATGLVGMNLARAFSVAAAPIRCLLRPASNLSHLLRWPVIAKIVDFGSEASLEDALQGAEVLIHAAYDPVRLDAVAIEPLYRAAGRAGIRHFVYISSSAVHAIHRGAYDISEDDPLCLDHPYARYKHREESFLSGLREHEAVPWTVVRPGNVYGPWDLKGFMFRWFRVAPRKSITLAGRVKNRIHLCHVDNMVALVKRVLGNQQAYGQVFFVADARAPELREIWRAMTEVFGTRLRYLPVPSWVVRGFSSFASRWPVPWAEVELPPKLATISRIDYSLSIAKSAALLGYDPVVDLEEGIRATARWYRSFGVL